jgi:MSHA pilin protein MshA
MNKNVKTAQAGFSLIELIIVVVIMGVLAATALPKFAEVGSDARYANLQSAKSALESVSSAVHGKALMSVSATDATLEDGTTVTFKNGYPQASAAGDAATLAKAAGLDGWEAIDAGTAAVTDKSPAAAAKTVVFVPPSAKQSKVGVTCFVTFAEAAANGTPTVTIPADASSCK